jgi:sigma-B regulation protein RsbU (phosphoserine phosphatase)
VELARHVQELFESPSLLEVGELSIATWMSVSHRVGGDFQIVRRYGPILRVIQGDVVGKGMAAALLAAYLVGLCDALTGEGLRPTQVLHSMNLALAERTEARPMFATVVALEVDLNLRTWKWARAGHELPLLLRRCGLEVTFDEEPSLPVGVSRGEIYSELEFPLLDGDRLFLGSDGILEVGLTRQVVLDAFRRGRGRADDLMQSLVALLPDQSFRDDVTMAIIDCDKSGSDLLDPGHCLQG